MHILAYGPTGDPEDLPEEHSQHPKHKEKPDPKKGIPLPVPKPREPSRGAS